MGSTIRSRVLVVCWKIFKLSGAPFSAPAATAHARSKSLGERFLAATIKKQPTVRENTDRIIAFFNHEPPFSQSLIPCFWITLSKLDSFCNTCAALVTSRRGCFAVFGLVARAISIRRRIASEREGLCFCCLAQFSMESRVLGGRRMLRTGSQPVAQSQHPAAR